MFINTEGLSTNHWGLLARGQFMFMNMHEQVHGTLTFSV